MFEAKLCRPVGGRATALSCCCDLPPFLTLCVRAGVRVHARARAYALHLL